MLQKLLAAHCSCSDLTSLKDVQFINHWRTSTFWRWRVSLPYCPSLVFIRHWITEVHTPIVWICLCLKSSVFLSAVCTSFVIANSPVQLPGDVSTRHSLWWQVFNIPEDRDTVRGGKRDTGADITCSVCPQKKVSSAKINPVLWQTFQPTWTYKIVAALRLNEAHGQDNVYKYLGKAGKGTTKQALIFSYKIRQLSYRGRLERLSYPDASTVIIGSAFLAGVQGWRSCSWGDFTVAQKPVGNFSVSATSVNWSKLPNSRTSGDRPSCRCSVRKANEQPHCN